MSHNDDVRYCQRFSYVFLKFILFFYAIIFWVSCVLENAKKGGEGTRGALD